MQSKPAGQHLFIVDDNVALLFGRAVCLIRAFVNNRPVCRSLGIETEHMLPETFYELMTVYCGRMDSAWVYPMNIVQWSDHVQSTDPMIQLDDADYFVMVMMATMMLRGLGEMLQQPRNLAVSWAPFARRALEEKGLLADVEEEIAAWFA